MSRSLAPCNHEDEMRALSDPAKWLATLSCVTMLACIETSGPVEAEPQVIEQTTFAPTLGIDLSAMEILESGVYIQDLTVGEGDSVVWGEEVRVGFDGWLSNGTLFDSDEHTLLMGNNEVIAGFEEGILGMRLGGVRRLIIPPALGFGNFQDGNVPGGSILIFEVRILNITR
jgi:FKBP-type peptidyl-prolyl cis-trans isomerase FkpA